MRIIDIERTKSAGNKTERFLSIQQTIASQQISLPRNGKHTTFVLEHMRKITANDSHRKDDICDTLYDGIKLGIMDNVIMNFTPMKSQQEVEKSRIVMGNFQKILQLRNNRHNR